MVLHSGAKAAHNSPWHFEKDDHLSSRFLSYILSQFNPVPLALELMDGSSLGKDYDMFCMILRNIERALKDVVDGMTPFTVKS